MPHCKRSHVESGNNVGLTLIKSNRRMEHSEDIKFHSLTEILKGMEYREITNLLNAVGNYIEDRKNTNRLL
jgi:hypothetical protein